MTNYTEEMRAVTDHLRDRGLDLNASPLVLAATAAAMVKHQSAGDPDAMEVRLSIIMQTMRDACGLQSPGARH